jgi:deoxyribodipyrimidine photo-lyase
MDMRTRQLKNAQVGKGPVLYWMSRDQRIHDNWALLTALNFARENKLQLVIVFNLIDTFLEAGARQFRFMLKGLEEVYNTASEYNIPFYLIEGDPEENIPSFIKEIDASVLFTDFDPIKIKLSWLNNVIERIDIPVYQTDAHNIVPAFIVSVKQEFSAAHFRRKIYPLLPQFTEEYPAINKVERTEFSRSAAPDFTMLVLKYTNPPMRLIGLNLVPGQHTKH